MHLIVVAFLLAMQHCFSGRVVEELISIPEDTFTEIESGRFVKKNEKNGSLILIK